MNMQLAMQPLLFEFTVQTLLHPKACEMRHDLSEMISLNFNVLFFTGFEAMFQ